MRTCVSVCQLNVPKPIKRQKRVKMKQCCSQCMVVKRAAIGNAVVNISKEDERRQQESIVVLCGTSPFLAQDQRDCTWV